MRISPVPAPSNTAPSQDASTSAHSQISIERAQAAFLGVKMTPSDSYEDPLIAKKRESIRSLKMKTQVSPERYLKEIQAAPQQDINAISDTSGQTNASLEATKPISPQYAALAKQRRALQLRERELAARERSLSSETPRTDVPDVLARLKAEPLSVLKEAGVTYDDLTQAILNNPINPEMQALKDELKLVKEEMSKNFNDRDMQARRQVLAEMRKEASELAQSGEDFGLIRETDSVPKVLTLIERTFDETGEVLDVQEAMALVEAELIKDAMRMANVNKIKSSLFPKPVQQTQPQSRPQMRTLTNRDTATPPMSVKARAIAVALGHLKR